MKAGKLAVHSTGLRVIRARVLTWQLGLIKALAIARSLQVVSFSALMSRDVEHGAEDSSVACTSVGTGTTASRVTMEAL